MTLVSRLSEVTQGQKLPIKGHKGECLIIVSRFGQLITSSKATGQRDFDQPINSSGQHITSSEARGSKDIGQPRSKREDLKVLINL